jgi:16S rRNA (cytidine1402-2'-O)-methyltransferase
MKPITYLGNLYLIPTTLGEVNTDEVLPITIKRTIDFVWDYIVENEKTARKFIKSINPEKKQSDLRINVLDKHNKNEDNLVFLQPCLEGRNVGLMSEAGCPGIADPGAAIVKVAHQKGIKVIPLVGPSSILLAMMSSGMNGQNFAFNGYLPIDKDEKKQSLKKLEKLSEIHNQSQIFIETP